MTGRERFRRKLSKILELYLSVVILEIIKDYAESRRKDGKVLYSQHSRTSRNSAGHHVVFIVVSNNFKQNQFCFSR